MRIDLIGNIGMTLSRRDFLAATATLALGAAVPAGAAAPQLRAAPATTRLAPAQYPETAVWAYGGQVPGPTLRLPQGARLSRRFVNALPQASTVHWHGIRIANAMDGVPDLTQPAVPPGGEFLYDFTLPDAGTYWYHPHNRTWEQMARGLYGPLIVEEPEPPQVDRDEVLIVDDWRLTADAGIDESFGHMGDWSHAGRLGNWITVNGNRDLRLAARRSERLRLVNAANARVFELGLKGLEGWVVALDGQPLEHPQPAGRITLAPAQRADLIVDVTGEAEAFLVSFERDGGYAVATFSIGDTARPEPLSAPSPLPANPVPRLGDLEAARRVRLHMEGGAMGRMAGATLDGERLGIRELVGKGMVWAFNGIAGMTDRPLVTAARGETAEIAFVADNPGDWLLHCHMLEHAAAGIMTWLRIEG